MTKGRKLALLLVLAVLAVPAVFLFNIWMTELRPDTKVGGQAPAEPFRIAGNFYYVGASDLTSFLITGPEGHVVLDGGYATTAQMIMASIAKLGFDIKDVKVLINSVPSSEHAAGLKVIQEASGAELWVSEPSADTIATGGDSPEIFTALRPLLWTGLMSYAPPRVDHRFTDGETIRLGPIALTAHFTPGTSRAGCTSWSFPVQDGDRTLNVVSACGVAVNAFLRYPEQDADRERSLRMLRSLPADIWVTNRARAWGRYRKYVASQTAPNPVDAFIDPDGYRAFLDDQEAELREGRVH